LGVSPNELAEMTSNVDAALIALLRENARAPVADLARRLGLSRTTVQSRIDRLEQSGVIVGYGVKLSADYEKSLVRAHILVNVSPKLSAAVAAELRRISEVRSLHSVSGNFDMIIMAEAPSVRDLDQLIDRIGAFEGVERTQSSIILSTRFDR
jgi:DNA-binding Lrp family transcriptional regulator